MQNPHLVSVIVPTKNSEKFLDRCLKSIRDQNYKNCELIVVDNFSSDRTKEIAMKYVDKFIEKGPERSAQVNFGVSQAVGDLVYKVDSDFVLEPGVISECVEKIDQGYDAVVVHNSPDVNISWIAKIRKFEVDMYKYQMSHSSARFLKKEAYLAIGGFNENITAGEDYDFQIRLNKANYKTGFISSEAIHLGEPTDIFKHMYKYYEYGKDSVNFKKANQQEFNGQIGNTIIVYIKNWKKFLLHPVSASLFAIYTFFKFGSGLLGLIQATYGKR